MARRLLTLGAVLMVALFWWWLLGPAPGGGGQPGPAAAIGRGPDPDLRIEIREGAAGAMASYRTILARHGQDAMARAWVADCIGANRPQGPDPSPGPVEQDLLHACWRAYADQADAVD